MAQSSFESFATIMQRPREMKLFLCFQFVVPVFFIPKWLVKTSVISWSKRWCNWQKILARGMPDDRVSFVIHAELTVITLPVIIHFQKIGNYLFASQKGSSVGQDGIPDERFLQEDNSKNVESIAPLGKGHIEWGSTSHLISAPMLSLPHFRCLIFEAISWQQFRYLNQRPFKIFCFQSWLYVWAEYVVERCNRLGFRWWIGWLTFNHDDQWGVVDRCLNLGLKMDLCWVPGHQLG